jgi:hypothetical protein
MPRRSVGDRKGIVHRELITLVLVPAGYLIAEDVKAAARATWHAP